MSYRHSMIDLFRAVSLNDTDSVREILIKNPGLLNDPDLEEFNGFYSPIFHALLKGYEEIVELLIELGEVDLNEFHEVEFEEKSVTITYLHLFTVPNNPVFSHEFKIAQILINHGANVNASDTNLELSTPLEMSLCYACSEQTIEFWLQNGASPNAPIYHVNKSAAFDAIYYYKDPVERKKILLLLLKYGLDAKFRKSQNGNSLLHDLASTEAEVYGDVREVADILINSGLDINEVDFEDTTPLHCAIGRFDYQLLLFFIQKGADVNRKNSEGMTSLAMAIEINRSDMVELLLSSGADINDKEPSGWTALHEACDHNFEPIMEFLVRTGADINAEDTDGRTPLSLLVLEISLNGAYTLIRKMSKLCFENQLVSQKNLDLIRANLNFQGYFDQCTEELMLMKSRKFYGPYSYYSVFKMSNNIKKLANLTKNQDFLKNFNANFSFSYFGNDLVQILFEAFFVRDRSLQIEFNLNSIFGNVFPDVVIKNFVNYLS